MPLSFEQLLELFDYDHNEKTQELEKKNEAPAPTSCRHEFVQLFSTVSCKYCGVDRDKATD